MATDAKNGLQPEAGAAPRIIKKYRNRRLYDTEQSSYITLAEVRELVMERKAFVVLDAKSGADVTRGVLLQILLEEEAGGTPMLSEHVLADMIRFYGHALQGFMKPYLEKNIQAMVEVQAMLVERSNKLNPELWAQFMRLQPPMIQSAMGRYIEQSTATLLDLQEQMNERARQVFDVFGFRN